MGVLFGILGAGFPFAEVVMTIVSVLSKTGNPKMAPSDLTSMTWVAFAVVAVFSLAAVFYLFNFLNRRDGSDFYHALPVSRAALYFSFLAAVLTWVWGIGILSFLCIVATALLGGTALTGAMVAVSFGLLLSATLFLVAATAVAVSTTGTRFLNLLVFTLILFVPNGVATAFTRAVSARVPSLPSEFVGAIGNVSLHNTLFLLTSDTSLYGGSSFVASIIVTTLWSIVLIGVGAWFFRRRLSELAETMTLSRGFLLVCRVAFAILLVVLGTVTLVGGSAANVNNMVTLQIGSSPQPTSFVMLLKSSIPLLAIILVAFLVFELLATRKLKRLWRVLPSFGLVLAFTVVFFGIIFWYSAAEKRFVPTASQIASVQVLSSGYDTDSGSAVAPVYSTLFSSDDSSASYNEILLQQIMNTDLVLRQAAATKLKEPFPANVLTNPDGYNMATLVVVRMRDGRTAQRLISVRTSSNSDVFVRALTDSPKAAAAFLALPKPNAQMQFSSNGGMFALSSGGSVNTDFVSPAQQDRAYRTLYSLFYDEYQKLSPEEQYEILYGDQSQGVAMVSTEATAVADFVGGGTVQVGGVLNMQGYSNTYNFATPKASEYYWKMTCLDAAQALDKEPSQVRLDQVDLYSPSVARGVYQNSATAAVASTDPFWAVKSARFVAAVQGGGTTVTTTEGATSSSSTMDDNPGEKEISNALMQQATAIIRPALSRAFDLNAPVLATISVNLYDETNRNQLSQASLTVPLTAREAAALQGLTK